MRKPSLPMPKQKHKAFPQEEELREKTARLNELNVMLNMDKAENEIVDDGRGDDAAEPVRGPKGWER